ncbi:MAG: hypothetical protein PHQ98_02525 [Candidatus ainarchaeum sp.]|nr:hypothetical protein [Candidatus ainarchaeum sp.]
MSKYIIIANRKKYVKNLEADLTFFLSKLIIELKFNHNLISSLKSLTKKEDKESKLDDKSKNNNVNQNKDKFDFKFKFSFLSNRLTIEDEYSRVIDDFEKGFSFNEALIKMNKRINSRDIRRVNSNLANLYLNGNQIDGIKKINNELLMKQRIESKEFSGKMMVYSLVFIALSAIVPSMFQSFIIIGSYFMEISLSALQIFLIIVIGFPLIDLMILLVINSKTPVFLKKNNG